MRVADPALVRPFTEDSIVADHRDRVTTDDLDALLAAVPPEIVAAVNALPDRSSLLEVVLDLVVSQRRDSPTARRSSSRTSAMRKSSTSQSASFGDDNRAGIERTLHRISAIRNRRGRHRRA